MMRARSLLRLIAASALTLLMMPVAMTSCGGSKHQAPAGATVHADSISLPDTLRVATLYSPTSYFNYREETMGIDHDLVMQMGRDKNMEISFEIAPTLARAIELLDSGKVDLIAYEVPVTAEYKSRVLACGPENISSQVLVQPRQKGKALISDVTELAGRDVFVEADSKYFHRLNNLNNEIGGGIRIHALTHDEMITEDLIDLVSRDSIPLTVVDSDIARLNKTYYPNLDINLRISFPQRSRWAVAPKSKWLADSIDSWIADRRTVQAEAAILKRYYELSKQVSSAFNLSFSNGKASPFDDLLRRCAKGTGWDWRLLAALAWKESNFDNSVVSWAGARGVMQIMPNTARAYGVDPAELTDNARCINLAVKILETLDNSLRDKVKDPQERARFVMAAYNSGLAHVLDAMALAAKYGLDPGRWHGNVEKAMLMKSKPEFYNDPVCRYGYSRGRETVDHINRIYGFYEKCRSKVPL